MRILLADGQAKVRFALRVLLGRQTGLEVVGEAADARELMALASRVHPDLVLLAWDLPDLRGVGSLPALRARVAKAAIIVLSGQPEAQTGALAEGADGFVSKGDPPEVLLEAIASCSDGRV